ncbi:MAG: biopolymer transporter ExbD, partial [Gammaproteobacteria bacterium]|nr:biopolymer transporter ExbD [Gammaproteobacteria bacterium]
SGDDPRFTVGRSTWRTLVFVSPESERNNKRPSQEINLPTSELAKPPDVPYEEPLTIQMLADGTILFAGDRTNSEGLYTALLREAQIVRAHAEKSLSDVTVIIRADRDAKTGDVQKIIQKCQDAEFDTFALRGRQSDVSTLRGP